MAVNSGERINCELQHNNRCDNKSENKRNPNRNLYNVADRKITRPYQTERRQNSLNESHHIVLCFGYFSTPQKQNKKTTGAKLIIQLPKIMSTIIFPVSTLQKTLIIFPTTA